METMTSFYEYVKGCSDDELLTLAKEFQAESQKWNNSKKPEKTP